MLTVGGSFDHFLTSSMTHVNSTTRPVDATAEAGTEGRGSGDSTKRMESVPLSDAGSHSGVVGDMDEGSSTWSYFFGSSTMTVSCIRGMIDHGYFTKGMCREPREETVLELHSDEAMVFEEFFTAGLRMPPHPFLSDILLKFQLQLNQLTPNTIMQLSKYIWVVMSFRGVTFAEGFTKRYEQHYQSRKWKLMELKYKGSTGALIFMPNAEARGQSLLLPSRTNGPEPGLEHGFTARFPFLGA
jgi:hypothetical protein